MLRQQRAALPPVPHPQTNGHTQYEGEEPEDDYSGFEAWGNDFDDDFHDGHAAQEEEYDNPDDLHNNRPVPRNVPHGRPDTQGRFQGNRPMPQPPGPGRQNAPMSPDDGAPPIIPRRGDGRAPPPEPDQRSSDPPPSLPSRGFQQQPNFEEDDNPSDEYLEPSEATLGRSSMQNDEQETYEDPDDMNAPAPPPARNQRREITAPAESIYELDEQQLESTEIYSEADNPPPPPPLPAGAMRTITQHHEPQEPTDIYSEADDLPPVQLATRKAMPAQRQLPQLPVPSPPVGHRPQMQPTIPVPRIPVPEPEPEESYEDPEDLVGPPGSKSGSNWDQGAHGMPLSGNHLASRALPPHPPHNDDPPHPQNIMKKYRPDQPKIFDTMKLREKKDGLRPLDSVFNSNQGASEPGRDDSDDESHTVKNLGVSGMIAKLGKKSAMFGQGATKVAESRSTVNKTNVSSRSTNASRGLPEPPPAVSTPHRLSDSSSNSISDDNSSGGGTITRRADDRLPPVPQPTPQSAPTPQIRPLPKVEIPSIRVEDENYYHDVDRKETDSLLDQMDRMYLVRPSKMGGPGSPYTLCVYYNKRVWNLKIRKKQEKCFALGTEHPKEKTFSTVTEMINHHTKHPITLAGRTESGQVVLGETPNDQIYDDTGPF